MEPRIQYCTTSDGVSIAYWTLGEGHPLVYLPFPTASHLQADWQRPQFRQWYERLIERWRLIRYDGRGTGLSQRDVADYSVGAWGLDLEAVVDRLELGQFALFAPAAAGAVAIPYAVRHPERVSNLILFGSWVRASDIVPLPRLQALRTLMEEDWELYTETFAHVTLGWSAGEEARRAAASNREGITPDVLQRLAEARAEIDVSDLLPQVRSPTLILHPRQSAILRVDVARELASRIPGASLALIEGTSTVSSSRYDTDAAFAAIEEFLPGDPRAPSAPAPPPSSPGDVITILFTDLVSSTALTQRLGDAKLHEVRRAHNTIVRDALAAHNGTEIKHTGDGIMASFASASGALECAVAVQRGVAERGDANLGVHIGLNAGEPIADERDLFGTSVDLARRVCDQASGGEILVSDVVRQLAAGKDFLFSDRGVTSLKGFDEPVRVWEVRWREDG